MQGLECFFPSISNTGTLESSSARTKKGRARRCGLVHSAWRQSARTGVNYLERLLVEPAEDESPAPLPVLPEPLLPEPLEPLAPEPVLPELPVLPESPVPEPVELPLPLLPVLPAEPEWLPAVEEGEEEAEEPAVPDRFGESVGSLLPEAFWPRWRLLRHWPNSSENLL